MLFLKHFFFTTILDVRYSESLPAHISQVLDALVKNDLPSACLFHRCLTDYASIEVMDVRIVACSTTA